MTAEALAICIGPNVLRSPHAASALAMMGSAVPVMKNLILLVSFTWIFVHPEPQSDRFVCTAVPHTL